MPNAFFAFVSFCSLRNPVPSDFFYWVFWIGVLSGWVHDETTPAASHAHSPEANCREGDFRLAKNIYNHNVGLDYVMKES